jgi:RimJ/RimL family protein N-acetyltransferase
MNITFAKLKSSIPEINIRPLKTSDIQSIYENVKDKIITRYTLQIPHPYRKIDAEKFIKDSQRTWKEKSAYVFGIELKDSKEIIGVVSLDKVDKKNKRSELGYWLGKKCWGKGITSAAVKLVLAFGFNELNLHRIYSIVFASNTASLRVLEKNRFLLEGILFESVWRNGIWHNMMTYGLLKDDFNRKLVVDREQKPD